MHSVEELACVMKYFKQKFPKVDVAIGQDGRIYLTGPFSHQVIETFDKTVGELTLAVIKSIKLCCEGPY